MGKNIFFFFENTNFFMKEKQICFFFNLKIGIRFLFKKKCKFDFLLKTDKIFIWKMQIWIFLLKKRADFCKQNMDKIL